MLRYIQRMGDMVQHERMAGEDTVETLVGRYCRASRLDMPQLIPWEGERLRLQRGEGVVDIYVPLTMLDMPPPELALAIYREIVGCHILTHLYPIARPMMPELTEALEQLCMVNGITQLPALLGTRSPFCSAMAIPDRNVIILGEDVLAMRPEQRLAVLAHEFGHVLNPGLEGMVSEHAADAAAVRLMGSPRPVADALRRSESTQRYVMALSKQMGGEEAAVRGELYQREKAQGARERYGEEEERVAFIRAQDPHDRSHLERLIAERDARLAEAKAVRR